MARLLSPLPAIGEAFVGPEKRLTSRWRSWLQRVDEFTQNIFGTANTFTALQTFSAGITLGNETLSTYDVQTGNVTIAFGGASTGVTYTTQTYTGVRIGARAWVDINLVLTSRGSSTGAATIQTLPWTPTSNVAGACHANNYTIGAGLVPMFDTNGTTVRLRSFNPTTGNDNSVAETQVDNDFSLKLSLSYAV